MWEWDHSFSSWQYWAKSITKSQIKKMQQAYRKSEEISHTIRALEDEEQKKVIIEMKNTLRSVF